MLGPLLNFNIVYKIYSSPRNSWVYIHRDIQLYFIQLQQIFIPSQRQRVAVEDHDDEYSDSPGRLSLTEESPRSIRTPTPIPSVHREEPSSRLHEVFSDDGSHSDGASPVSHQSPDSRLDEGNRRYPVQDPSVMGTSESVLEDYYMRGGVRTVEGSSSWVSAFADRRISINCDVSV